MRRLARLLPPSVRLCMHGHFEKRCQACSPLPTILFVYGTLMRGFGNSRFLAGARFLGLARTRPGYRLRDLGGIPAMTRDGGARERVSGEVFEVPAAHLERVDRFEGHPSFYRRMPVEVRGAFSQRTVESYVIDPPSRVATAEVVPGGDWRAYHDRRG